MGRVVLHREDTEPDATLWAGAARSVLRSLEVADFWKVSVDQAADGWLVSVDYRPAARSQP